MPSHYNKISSSIEIAYQGPNNGHCGPSTDVPQCKAYAANHEGGSFVQSMLSSPRTDVLDYPHGGYEPIGASVSSIESEAEQQRREKDNLPSRKSRTVKKSDSTL